MVARRVRARQHVESRRERESAETLPGPYNSYYDADDALSLGDYDAGATERAKRAIMDGGAIVANYYADVSTPDDVTQETDNFSLKNWCAVHERAEGREPLGHHRGVG